MNDTKCTYEPCIVNGIYLHSKYNPSREAEHFVNAINTDIDPIYIVITGPALSYCLPFLRQKFPNANLVGLFFCEEFYEKNNNWDLKLLATKSSLAEKLFDLIGEESWSQSLFVSWKPSERAFPNEYTLAWEAIKKATIKSRNVLTTRAYFTKKWAINCVQFCKKIKNHASIKAGEEPIIIAASGNSLIGCIEFLKEERENFFLMALSSAAPVLLMHNITPDLLITTDGGHWAAEHLLGLERFKKSKNIPIAAAMEASLPSLSFYNNTLIPLVYGDSLDTNLAEICNIKTTLARRNGTVSGTAAELALKLTTNAIYFCGLDLSEDSQGFSHAQPNILELYNSNFDTKLSSKENRLSPKSNTDSLNIYASWFSSQGAEFTSRIMRIKGKHTYSTSLHPIKDITIADAKLQLKKTYTKRITINAEKTLPKTMRINALHTYFIKTKTNVLESLKKKDAAKFDEKTIFWLKIINIAQFLQVQRGNADSLEKLTLSVEKIFNKIERIIQK